MDVPLTATGVSSPLSSSDLHPRPSAVAASVPFHSSPATPAASASEDQPPPSKTMQEQDSPTCRFCFGTDSAEEIAELGALIVPCKCSGTVRSLPFLSLPLRLSTDLHPPKQARFIHPACLDSWRTADRKNGFYACGTCGFKYRLRESMWTKLQGYRGASFRRFLSFFCFGRSVLTKNEQLPSPSSRYSSSSPSPLSSGSPPLG
jgi:hypothetical protein